MLKKESERIQQLAREVKRLKAEGCPNRDLFIRLLRMSVSLVNSDDYLTELTKARSRRRAQREGNWLLYYEQVGLFENYLKILVDKGVENILLSSDFDVEEYLTELSIAMKEEAF